MPPTFRLPSTGAAPDSRLRRAALALGAAALLAVPAAQAHDHALTVSDAWARPTVAGQAGGGGFLKIKGGPAADRLVGAASPVAQRVELHTMSMEGDVMRMREVRSVDVPAKQTVEFKPGGLHVMFIGLKEPLKTGSRFPMTLRFEKAGEVAVQVEVTPRGPGAAAGHGHGSHKH
jgi:copper(I)-binding protein